jgi:spore germination protein GerM
MLTRRSALIAIASVAVVAAVLLAVLVPRWRSAPPDGAVAPAPSAPAAATGRKITATLYYISEDGMSLIGVQREVPFGDAVLDQARYILEAQLGPAPAPQASAIPDGTTLRGLYFTERGDAFVDLSSDARTKHIGGAIEELFTVYTIVNALTVNLPAVKRVQILVDGREVDTLAGHVDLRHPLQKNLQWIKTEKEES